LNRFITRRKNVELCEIFGNSKIRVSGFGVGNFPEFVSIIRLKLDIMLKLKEIVLMIDCL